jgi:LacI family transcriptional regulator
MKVNIRKISEVTGFSPATVSNALNHKKGVNAETAAKIWETARELGYAADSKITKVKFVMYKKRGYVVEDTPFFPLMIAGVEEECRALGLDMTLCNLDRRAENFNEVFHEICAEKGAALILLGTEIEDEDIDLIRSLPDPFVVIDYWKEDMTFDAVLINNADSARMATEYLARNGHTKIGYLKGEFRIKPFRSRYVGYQTALKKAGLKEDPNYTVSLSCNMDGAYQDMKAYLKKKPKLPTAFFADNDIIALGAMKAMWEEGIRIPEDVSVVGFDDLSYSSISNPPLTTLRVPKQDMGKVAVRRLRDMLADNGALHLKTQVCTEFVERSSVKKL